MENRLHFVFFLFILTAKRAWIVPCTVAGLDVRHIHATPRVLLNIIDERRIDDRRIGIEITFLEPVYNNARRGGNNFDVLVGDSVFVEREEDFTSSFAVGACSVTDCYSSEE